MTAEQINALTLEDRFFEILNSLVDFRDIPEGEQAFEVNRDANFEYVHPLYDNITLHPSKSLPTLAAMEAALAAWKVATIAEMERIEDLKQRIADVKVGDLHGWFGRAVVTSNPVKWIEEEILNNSDHFEAETNLQLLEAKRAEHIALEEVEQPKRAAKEQILRRMDWGKALIAEFGAKNALRGYTKAQVKKLTQDMSLLQSLVSLGALETALEELQAMQPTAEFLQTDKDEYITKIQSYLGV